MRRLVRYSLLAAMAAAVLSYVVLAKSQVNSPSTDEKNLLNELNQRLETTRTAVTAVDTRVLALNLSYYDAKALGEGQQRTLEYIDHAREYITILGTRPRLSTRFLLNHTLDLLDRSVDSFAEVMAKAPKIEKEGVHRTALAELLTSKSELNKTQRQLVQVTFTVLDAADSKLQRCTTGIPQF